MRPGITRATALATVCVVAVAAAPGPIRAEPADDYASAFELLRSLTGTWDAVRADDESRVNTITYHVTGGGVVVYEEFLEREPGEDRGSMATAYHLDNEGLMLTHYCGAGNQPRMRAVSFDEAHRLLRFEFLDVTNLSAPDDYYTTVVELLFEDDNHVELRFQGVKADESTDLQVHRLTRRSND